MKTNITLKRWILVLAILLLVSLACGKSQEAAPVSEEQVVEESVADVEDLPEAEQPLTAQEENILFQDDFQDGQPDEWDVTTAWYVQHSEDIYIFSASGRGGAWLPQGSDWRDYAFRTRVRIDAGSLLLSLNLSQGGRYMVHLNENGVYLLKEEPADNYTVLTQTCPLEMGDWHSIAFGAQNGHLQVYVDQALWIDYTDNSPITGGTIAVSSLEGSRVAVDDVMVSQMIASLPNRAIEAPTGCEVAEAPVDAPAGEVSGLTLEEVDEGGEPPPVVKEQIEEDEEEQDDQGQEEQDQQTGLPELHISHIAIVPSSPDQGQAITIALTVFNSGEADAGSFNILWYPEEFDFIGCSWDIFSLVSGEPVDMTCDYQGYSNAGTFTWNVVADAENEVVESIEDNNTQSGFLTVNEVAIDPPPAPIDCTATVLSSTEVLISWDINQAAPRDGFSIYQGTDSLEKWVGQATRETTIGNLSPNTQYHFDVRAYNEGGESSADACFVDVTTDP